MEIVEVNCPRSINLKDSKDDDIDSIRQTIDIYDSVVMHQEIKKTTGIVINTSDNLKEEFNDQVKKIIHIFEQYVGIIVRDLIIEIKDDPNQLLFDENNILSGIIVALNNYFKCNLSNHELIYLSQKINQVISYYLQGGYKKILKDGKIKNIANNPYQKYFLIDSYDYSKEDLIKIKNIIGNKDGIDYFEYNYDFPFIALKENIATVLPIYLKKEFSKMQIHSCKNTFGNKVLIKYLK